MKKITFLICAVALVALITVSCKEKSSEQETLTVTAKSEVITVGSTDVTENIVISSTKSVSKEITLSISTNATDGSAVLSKESAVITKGGKETTVTITFPADKFPEGTPQKDINVIVKTTDSDVRITNGTVVFKVKGSGEEVSDKAELTVTTAETTLSTASGPADAVLEITLSKALANDVELVCEYTHFDNFVGTDFVSWDPYPVIIPANSTSLTLTITAEQGASGSMPITFSCKDKDVVLKTASLDFEFVNQ